MPASDAPVLVAVSVDPETSHRANEAVRIALGVLAGENRVTIALLGAGAKVLDADVEDYVDGEDLAHLASNIGRCWTGTAWGNCGNGNGNGN